MSFIDHFGDVAFKTTADGKRVFFPYGFVGKGRVVDTDETYRRLFSHQKWWTLGALVSAILLQKFLAGEAMLGYLVLFAAVHYFFTTRLIKGLPLANESFNFQDAKSRISNSLGLSKRTLWFLAIFVLFLMAIVFLGTPARV